MNKLIRYVAIIFCFCQSTQATVLPENHSVNGGLTIIPVDIKKEPEAFFQGKRLPVLPSINSNQWLLIVAIPLANTDTIQNIEVKTPYKAIVPFQVSEQFYRTQSLNIKDISKVDPHPEDKERIEQETEKLSRLFAHYSHNNPFKKRFAAPIHGPISSLFGLKRVYNHQPRAPHSGLDIAAPQGKPIKAASDGIVADTGNYFYTGNTVIIDHGMGVFSLYAHMSKIMVHAGESVHRGQELGLVGMTGRVTGPHLHWTMVVNQTLVDPLLFVPRRIITQKPAAPEKKPSEDKAKQS